jgi:hypothetical protein
LGPLNSSCQLNTQSAFGFEAAEIAARVCGVEQRKPEKTMAIAATALTARPRDMAV